MKKSIKKILFVFSIIVVFLVLDLYTDTRVFAGTMSGNPYGKSISIQQLLSDYQYFCNGNLTVLNHTVGAIVCGGDAKVTNFGDGSIAPSYLGNILQTGNYNGTGNSSFLANNANYASYTGLPVYYKTSNISGLNSSFINYTNTTPFINLTSAFSTLETQSSNMASSAYTVNSSDITGDQWNGYTLNIPLGTHKAVVIPKSIYDSINYIKLCGVSSLAEFVDTEFSISFSGITDASITFAYISFNSSKTSGTKGILFSDGQSFNNSNSLKNITSGNMAGGQLNTNGMKLIWNFPDAITLASDYTAGHIVAPKAAVTLTNGTGNFEGGIIAKDIVNDSAEGHFFPYMAIGSSYELTPTPTPEVSETPTPTPTPEVSETSTPTPTPEVSETPTPIPTSEVSETPTPTPSPEVSETPTPTPSSEVSETPTPTPTPEVSETPTPTPTSEVSETPTPTPTSEVSETPTPTPTPEVSETPTPTPTPDVSKIPVPTPTPVVSKIPVPTPTPDVSETPTPTQLPAQSTIPVPTKTPVSNENPTPAASSNSLIADGIVVDNKTGDVIQKIPTEVSTDNNSRLTVSFDSQDTILFKQPDDTICTFNDVSKLGFSSTNVVITSDGNIKVENLEKGTKETITVTYNLGNGQKIDIGKIDVEISSTGEVKVVSKLIDPYGIITDADTGKIINKVDLTLYYADTKRNTESGKTPNTEVQLPIIEGFKPNNNLNPQISDADGAYAFMVYPNTDYYIVAKKDGYGKYVSPTISVNKEIVKFDIKMHKSDETGIIKKDANRNYDIKNIKIKRLPQSGSFIDFTVLITFGTILILMGIICRFKKLRIK